MGERVGASAIHMLAFGVHGVKDCPLMGTHPVYPWVARACKHGV
jgi:hypothetical protein